jgi:glycosyltransferase involved in cell wall biosynthesis
MPRKVSESNFVSIVIPCYNEKHFIGKCLDSIIANDYSKDKLEIIIVDGMSTDGTRNILEDYVKRYPFIRLLDNIKKEQQIALNIGITNARGNILMRIDAHSTYKENYISECIRGLNEYHADNVGGRWVTLPRDNSLMGRAICFAMSVPFGVGNAYYRLASLSSNTHVLTKPRWGISVPYFCCRKEIFEKIGLFNEKLDRSEDIDFRARLNNAGYKTLFMPTVVCYYFMRTDFKDFLRHMFRNGIWVVLPLNYTPGVSFSMRHVVPLAFVVSLMGTGIASFFSPLGRILFTGIVSAYLFANIYYSARIAMREKDLRYLFILLVVFTSLHVSYGLGSIVGLIRTGVLQLLKRVIKKFRMHKH